jgi:hypothetical protein
MAAMSNFLLWTVRIAFILIALTLAVNGACMLIRPRDWWLLPNWIRIARFSVDLRHTQFGQGFGSVQVRVLGASILVVTSFFAFVFGYWLFIDIPLRIH